MKNSIYFLLSLLFVCLFCSCQEKKTFRIGVSQCSSDDWRNKCNDEIQCEIMFHPEASVEIRSADDSNEKQAEDIRYFVQNHFDIIICSPNEADAMTPVVKEAYESGIPVIIFDRNIHGDSYTAYIGVDNIGIGESAAHYARHLIGEGGKVIEIYGRSGSTPAIERHNGFMEEAKRNGLQLLASGYGNWDYDDASAVCDSLYLIYKDVDLVYAHNDRMAIAASDAARRHGLKLKVIGIDAAPEIGLRAVADGVISATFIYPTEGYRLVRTALAILKGEPYERRVVLPKSSVVDSSNADILMLQNETLKDETDKIKVLKHQVDEYWSQHSAQTTLFYFTIAFLCLLFVMLFLLLHAFWQRKKYQTELQQQNRQLEAQRDTEKALNEQLLIATQSKLMFFTNVSHDLRTPLTLIADPVEQLAASTNLTPQQHTLVRIANKNVLILKRLINQILDFRKYENGKLDLHLQEAAFAPLVRSWAEAFNISARKHDITLVINLDIADGFTLAIDVEKMERVFFNLLSNAFKYTPQNGKITFTCNATDTDLVFSVKDTGKGISSEDIKNIFTRFYQVDKANPQCSGIGLALVKAFVELHGGIITAESEVGKGSTFTVTLPIHHVEENENIKVQENEKVETPNITESDVDAELDTIEQENPVIRPDVPLLLVIDDNEDIRRMIAVLMGDDYNVISASNGKEGLSLAAKYVPDVIICDVMMPVMDGLECCRHLKEEVFTSHIPVLMLTACSLDEQRAQGYDSGADGYLSKPFNSMVLKSRCRNLIENRKRIRNAEIDKPVIAQSDANSSVLDMENKFYARFLEIVNAEMGNPELNVDQLAAKMGLGRSQFYRKIKALTNYSPVELLRNLRLKKSRELLLTTDKSISEIAYEVGFSAPAYFTRCYREAFGETPTDRRSKVQ